MNWQGLHRRLPLPLIGCILGVGGYLGMQRPAQAEASLASGYRAIWLARYGEAARPMLDALRLDPGSPERWSDLAEAMYETGRGDDTRYCVERSLSRAPGLPHVAMRAAGMYFRLGDREGGLRLTHRVVSEAHEYDENVFQTWQRLGGTAADVFEWGVGSNARAGRAYFRFLLDSGNPAATDAAWLALRERGMAGVDESRFYAESLMTLREYARAAGIESVILPDGVWNGGFESEWAGRGPDWRVESIPGVTVSRDTSMRYRGNASLRVDFDGSNRGAFQQVSQTRALAGGGWRLRAMLRTELKDTNAEGAAVRTGIGLRVVDGENGRVLAETVQVNSRHDWMPVEARLDAGSRARPVRIEIARPATPASEFTMTGTVWIDDVTLTAEAPK